MAGYGGIRFAADLIEGELRRAGVQRVARERLEVAVPVDHGASIHILGDDREIPLHSLWPNLVRTTSLGPDGIEGELLYGAHGEPVSLNGKVVEGSVVLLEFNSWDRWRNAASLGARAVIFIAPERTTLFEARRKWAWVPLDVPRFWLERRAGLALKSRLDREELRVHLESRMTWERHDTWNIWGVVPGIDADLRDEWIAVQSYYDGTSVVPALAPSAQTAAGIAALLELAHYLRAHPPARSVVLIATGAHFLNSVGLRDFLSRHARRNPYFRERAHQRVVAADSLEAPETVELLKGHGLLPDSSRPRPGDNDAGAAQRILAGLDGRQFERRLRSRGLTLEELGVRLEPDTLSLSLLISLDLSSRSDQIGVWHNLPALQQTNRKLFLPLGRSFMRHARPEAPAHLTGAAAPLVNGVSATRGVAWESLVSMPSLVVDGYIARSAGLISLSLMTVNDDRLRIDTPLDRLEQVEFGNVERQSTLINEVLHGVLGDPLLFGRDPDRFRAGHDRSFRDVLVDLEGGLRLAPRGTAAPREGVPSGIVALMPGKGETPWRPQIFLADEGGNYTGKAMDPIAREVHGFVLDHSTGEVTYATDRGKRAQDVGCVERTLSGDVMQWTTVVFPARPMEVYERIHPRDFSTLPGRFEDGRGVLDRRGGPPQHYGFVHRGWHDPTMVLYGPAGVPLRLVDESYLLLNNANMADDEDPEGRGFDPAHHGRIRRVTLQAAADMWRLDEARIGRLRKYGVENLRLQELHDRAATLIGKAEAAWKDREYDRYLRFAREALGVEARAYPDVAGTQNDVMAGLVFFIALLLPAAFFAERLLFAAAHIHRRILLFALVLLAMWMVLSLVHPAFQLAHPAIVLLALMIGIMAVLVAALVMGRFDQAMTAIRQRRAPAEGADISRAAATYTAFMLGISNMRRRPMRTALTLTTITLLTFSVLSFTSFRQSLRFVRFDKDWPAPYHGALLHDVSWWHLDQSVLDYTRSHFEEHGELVPRNWMLRGTTSRAVIPVRHGARRFDASALLGMTAGEDAVTGVAACLTSGTWFESEDEQSVIIADALAEGLGLAASDVGRAGVSILGEHWLVRGIFDAERFDALRDLNNEPLTPARIQFSRAGMEVASQAIETKDDVDLDLRFEHLPARRLVIAPYHVLHSMGAPTHSIAVHLAESSDGEGLVRSFLTRAGFRLFTGLPDSEGVLRAGVYSSIGVTGVSGLGPLLVPIGIAALIVLNTMMGATYERSREIGVYSSVGLAPMHIAFLFLAEACVYAVLGVALGYLLGQTGAKVLGSLALSTGISLNYSSMAAITSAGLVIFVVLASAAYPARVASRAAVPDVVRRWQLAAPEGDVWEFTFPFTVNQNAAESLCGFLYSTFSAYGDESVGRLYTEKTRIVVDDRTDGSPYSVQLGVWLAPFDLGVSEYLQFELQPAAIPGTFGIEVYIERLSGPRAFWERLNLGFLLELRRQFMIWQTLKKDIQQEYADTARRVAIDARKISTH